MTLYALLAQVGLSDSSERKIMNYDNWKTTDKAKEGPHPIDDERLVASFCQEHSDDFDMWFNENAHHPAKKSQYEQSYCEAHLSDFLNYASNNIEEE